MAVSPRPEAGRRAGRRGARGFSLIEALVAMVIVASSGWALLSWINASVQSLARVEDANARSVATSDAIEFMQTVNPMLRPEGRAVLGDDTLSWRARLLTPVQDGSNFPRGIGNHQLALYETTVRVARGDADGWVEFQMRQVGWRTVRQSGGPLQP